MKVGDLVRPLPTAPPNQALWCRGMIGIVAKVAENNVATVYFGENCGYLGVERLEVVSESR
ncbi:MAG: hypothetical protein VYC40_01725 [Pseudomonadota bacterium]|nr:hypothetical protein [Pseudomonadota bacterium]